LSFQHCFQQPVENLLAVFQKFPTLFRQKASMNNFSAEKNGFEDLSPSKNKLSLRFHGDFASESQKRTKKFCSFSLLTEKENGKS
jgi:hypothetical protein